MNVNVKEILSELKKHSSKENREGMARFGIDVKYALGVNVPVLRSFAKKIGKNHELAKELWKTKIHEARILATMIDEPGKVSEEQADSWIKEFNSWDLCDQCCMNLFDKLPFSWKKAIEWTKRTREFEKRAGFALMACLAWHDKNSDDSEFIKFFPIIKIKKNCCDERNFVKKAVNWALRQIGKKNNNLKKEALKTAEQILKENSSSKVAKWIANDAIRELNAKKLKG